MVQVRIVWLAVIFAQVAAEEVPACLSDSARRCLSEIDGILSDCGNRGAGSEAGSAPAKTEAVACATFCACGLFLNPPS